MQCVLLSTPTLSLHTHRSCPPSACPSLHCLAQPQFFSFIFFFSARASPFFSSPSHGARVAEQDIPPPTTILPTITAATFFVFLLLLPPCLANFERVKLLL
ncbi:hypothetical protein QOT17_006518 [Balamuthia mandrillaris]